MIAQGGTQSLGLYDFKRQLDAFGGVDYFRESLAGGYLPNARVMLNNGDIVRNVSGVNNNRNPNIDMVGWENTSTSIVGKFVSIEDFGASETGTREANTLAINNALSTEKRVYFPCGKSYPVNLNGIHLNTDNYLFGSGELAGPDPDQIKADVAGQMLRIDNCENVVITDLRIKNGYKGKGVWMTNSRNIEFNNVTIDGFSYGMWIGESASGIGCQNIRINKPRVLKTKYWGIYVRCLDVTDESAKTKNVTCTDGYFYWCNMAAFVCAEGHVSNVSLINPIFDSCNVAMHFETCSDYTVINARDYDTGKKAGMIPANTEYPYSAWSLYQVFTQNSKIVDCSLSNTVWIGAASTGKSSNHRYINTSAKEFVFEGAGTVADTDKNFFTDYSFIGCSTTGVFLYQQNDTPQSYISGLTISNCYCGLGSQGNSGNGSYIAMNPQRCIDVKIVNNTFKNSALRIKCNGTLIVTGNTFEGTDQTQSQFNGGDGSLTGANFFEYTGNIYKRAGGAVIGASAVTIQNFTRVKVDNTMRGNSVQYGYTLTNNRLIEMGYNWVYDTTVGSFTESGTTALVYLYRAST